MLIAIVDQGAQPCQIAITVECSTSLSPFALTLVLNTDHSGQAMESRKFRFKEQRPPGRTYHRQIKREEWDRYKNVIGKMHEAKCPRNEILRRLKEEWDFDPS